MFSIERTSAINPRNERNYFSNSKLKENNDSATEEDDEETKIMMANAKETRRLAKLFGSKSHGCCAIKKKKDDYEIDIGPITGRKNNPSVKIKKDETEQTHDAVTTMDRLSQPKHKAKKFMDRTEEERNGIILEDMHADNDPQIENPWFVGYRNSASLPAGSLLSIAKRYGSTSAIKLSKQCSDRVSTTALEKANKKSEDNNDTKDFLKSDLLSINQWEPPLIAAPHGVTVGKLGGGGHFASSPKLWPGKTQKNSSTPKTPKEERELQSRSRQHCSPFANKKNEKQGTSNVTFDKDLNQVEVSTNLDERTVIPPRLSRVIDREAETWKQVADEAERERRLGTSSRSKRRTESSNKNKQQTSSKYTNRLIKNHVYNNKIASFKNGSASTSQDLRFHRMGLSSAHPKSKTKIFVLS